MGPCAVAGDDGHPSELAKPSCVYRMWKSCAENVDRDQAKVCTEGKQSMVGPKVAHSFGLSRSHTYNIQAYFLLPIISRVSLNSYNSQNLADDEKASFLKVVFRTCVALYYSA